MANLVITKQTGDFWSFVLDGDTANEILNTRNDLLVYGNYCHFKTADGAKLVERQDILPSDVTIIASSVHNPSDKHELFQILIAEGYFDWIKGGGSGGTGIDRFDELLDTFKYVGKNGMAVIVDETQLRLVAKPFYNISKSTELADMPKTLVGNQMLVTDETGTKYIYLPIPDEPEQFLNTIGYFIYEDLATQSAPIAFTTNTSVKVPNDGEGEGTDFSQAPFAVSNAWNVTDNQMYFGDLSIGDTVDFRMGIEVDASTNDQKYSIILKTAIGSPSEETQVVFSKITKSAGVDTQTFMAVLAIANQDIIDFPAELHFVSDANGTFKISKFLFRIIRKNINLVQIGAEGLELKEDKSNKQPILGNEDNEDYYPSVKDVVEYFSAQGASDLQAVLEKGDTADHPMVLMKGFDNYISFFHPAYSPDGFRTFLYKITNVSGFNHETLLNQTGNLTGYDLSIVSHEPSGSYFGVFSIRKNVVYLQCTYQDGTGHTFEYTIGAEKDCIFIKKRGDTTTRKLKITIERLLSDVTVEAPNKDGTLALTSDILDAFGALTTDSVPEGTNPARFYFSTSRVLATLLSGLSTATGGTILPADTILQAFGKLQYQINNMVLTSGAIITALGYTPENQANKKSNITTATATNTTSYPSNQGFTNFIKTELVTFISDIVGDIQDADFLFIGQEFDYITRKFSYANLKANLLSYFNTKFQSSVGQITLSPVGNITTDTKDVNGLSQGNRHVIIDNGSLAINLTVNGVGVTPVSYGKRGTGIVTFVQGAGRTLVAVGGVVTFSGALGSTASLYSVGTIDYLSISNV